MPDNILFYIPVVLDRTEVVFPRVKTNVLSDKVFKRRTIVRMRRSQLNRYEAVDRNFRIVLQYVQENVSSSNKAPKDRGRRCLSAKTVVCHVICVLFLNFKTIEFPQKVFVN